MKYLLDEAIIGEVEYLANFFQVDSNLLYYIAYYTVSQQKNNTHQEMIPLQSLKKAIFNYFEVKNTTELKKSKSFQKATQHLAPLNLKQRHNWEKLYKEFISYLPSGNEMMPHKNTSSAEPLAKLNKCWQDLENNTTLTVYDHNSALQKANKALYN